MCFLSMTSISWEILYILFVVLTGPLFWGLQGLLWSYVLRHIICHPVIVHTTLCIYIYIYIVYTPFCMLGVYMHIGSIHGILYYQFPSSAGIPSCWFSSCLVLFYPPCLVVQWVLDSFDPSSLRTRNRLFLSVAGRLGSTLFLGVVSSS